MGNNTGRKRAIRIMNMWLILMIVLAVLSFAGILYLANRIGKFAFIRKITKGKKGIQHTDRTSDCCSLYRSYLDGMGFYECYCVYSASDRILDGQRSDFCPDHKDTQKDICKILCRDRGDRFYCMLSCSRLISGTSCVGEEV